MPYGHIAMQLSVEIVQIARAMRDYRLFNADGLVRIAVDKISLCQRVHHVRVEPRRQIDT